MKTILIALMVSSAIFGNELKVLNWNSFLLPWFTLNTHQTERAHLIGQWLKENDADIITLQEVFQKKFYKIIKAHLREKYPYDTGNLFRSWYKPVSSGLVIFSKFPIVSEKIFKYSWMKHADRFSTKGLLVAKIQIAPGKSVKIGTTHMQAQTGHVYTHIREGQIAYIRDILQNEIASEEPFILTGDFNVDKYSEEYANFKAELKFSPMRLAGKQLFTVDSEINTFKKDKREQKLLDYTFLYAPFSRILEQTILDPRGDYGDNKSGSLSDHQPLETLIELL